MADEIKRLILGVIPNQKCNLRCKYCYISQVDAWEEPTELKYSIEHVTKCLSKKRLGGVSLINLTGNGETMLQPDIVELTKALLEEGHFVEIVTNGTVTKHIDAILEFPEELLDRLFFKISFHYKELLERKMIDQFWKNVRNIRQSKASFTLELMANDDIEEDISEIKEECIKNVGAVCQATIGRCDRKRDKRLLSAHDKNTYYDIWKKLDSPMLDFKLDVLGNKNREFCYAGAWSLFVNMYTGESQQCYWQPFNQNIFENPEAPIKFIPVGYGCTQPYCTNAHAHLTWGLVPNSNSPYYVDMRNRICDDGTEWLKKNVRIFLLQNYMNQMNYLPNNK